jgi:hypothetical protein
VSGLGVFARRVYFLLMIEALWMGTAIIAGGGERFSADSLQGARQIVDIIFGWTEVPRHLPWGFGFLLYGLALAMLYVWRYRNNWHKVQFVLWTGSAPYLFFALGIGLSVDQPKAVLTGIGTYSVIAAVHLLLADEVREVNLVEST